MRVSLTASGAFASVAMPVSIAFYPPAAIPLSVVLVVTTVIVVWHLKQGGRAIVRRTPKGTLTFTLDSLRRNRERGTR